MNFLLDYILAYEIDTGKDEDWQQKREEKRSEFEANLVKAHLELEAEGIEVRKSQNDNKYKEHVKLVLLVA